VKLEDILNAVSIALEHDGITFRLVPMTSAAIIKWNSIMTRPIPKGEDADLHAHFQKQRDDQIAVLADQMRLCVTDGDPKKINAKWMTDKLPNNILQDLAQWFVESKRPTWASDGGK